MGGRSVDFVVPQSVPQPNGVAWRLWEPLGLSSVGGDKGSEAAGSVRTSEMVAFSLKSSPISHTGTSVPLSRTMLSRGRGETLGNYTYFDLDAGLTVASVVQAMTWFFFPSCITTGGSPRAIRPTAAFR